MERQISKVEDEIEKVNRDIDSIELDLRVIEYIMAYADENLVPSCDPPVPQEGTNVITNEEFVRRLVSFKMKKDSFDNYLVNLRDEKQQLRDKEKQLRDKENKLRDEKSKLMDDKARTEHGTNYQNMLADCVPFV